MATGREAKAAFKKAATWGTAVAVSAEDLFLFTSEKITRSIENLPDDSAGRPFTADRDPGLVTCAGDLSAYLRYQGLEVLLAMAMGQAGTPSLEGESSSAYRHQLRLAADTDGLFGTLAVYKGVSVHEYPSCKVDGFTISGEAGQPLNITFNLICDDLNLNTTEGTNTAAAMAALTLPAPGNRILFRQGTFLLNDATAAALSDNDRIHPSRFSLTFKRGLEGDYLAGGNDRIAEPIGAGFPEVSLELEFPTYTSDTYLHDLGSDTRKKMKISFQGQEIETGYPYRLEIMIPHLVITNAEAAVDKAGKIAHPISALCLATTSERPGMSDITAPFAIDLVNTRSTDPLA